MATLSFDGENVIVEYASIRLQMRYFRFTGQVVRTSKYMPPVTVEVLNSAIERCQAGVNFTVRHAFPAVIINGTENNIIIRGISNVITLPRDAHYVGEITRLMTAIRDALPTIKFVIQQ